METAIRRRRKSGKRTGRRSVPLSRTERRRLTQLAVSLVVFGLAFFGRNIFPERISQWKAVLGENTDFRAAFTQFGEAVSRGEPVMDTLNELWVEVFAGGGYHGVNQIYEQVPDLEERVLDNWAQPDDPIGAWCAALLPADGTETAASSVSANEETAAEQTSAGGETVTKTAEPPSGTPTLDLQVALISTAPQTVTAVAQTVDEAGRDLPASVSMQQYDLGLGDTVTPVAGTLTSDYGYRDHPVSGDYLFHRGVDIGAVTGTPIAAFASGTVEFIGESEVSGLYVQIDHGNGVETFYAHCSALYVSQGDTVQVGDTIAAVGETGNATGPHLHFAVIKDGIYLDPLFYIQVS